MIKTRRVLQFGFLLLTVVGVFVVAGNAERWCPFGGVEAIYTYVSEGNMPCSLGVSNFYILGGVLLLTLLTRRSFCAYMCPIGAVSEWLQSGARRLGVKPWRVPAAADRVLSLLKYVVLAVILYFTYRAGELLFRGYDPCYALISRHGEDITWWAYAISGVIVLASLLILIPFCRWLCPLAAVFNPFSRFGLTRIKRSEEACNSCGLCAKTCPMAIPVDRVREVRHARCTSCMQCVDACPPASRALSWGPPDGLGKRWPRGILVLVLLACTSAAVAAAYAFPMASFVKSRGSVPTETASLELRVGDLTCRGRSTLFAYYLERDDVYEIPGYLKIETWPAPEMGRARITYDPSRTDEQSIKLAITEPYYDAVAKVWRPSPFAIEGYDPFGL